MDCHVTMVTLSRRSLLAAGAIGAGGMLWADAGRATAFPFAKQQGPGVYRYRVGGYQVTALYDGAWYVPIDDKFIRNADRAQVEKALADAFLPPGTLPVTFTALLVNTGTRLILIDTGTAGQITDTAGVMMDNLRVAGVAAAAVDTVLISHFHPDHIDGLKTKDGEKVFPNAEILVPEPEWTFWMDDGNLARATGTVHKYFLNARRIFRDIAKEVRHFKPGDEVAPGILSVPAYGHTPGHTAFTVHSGSESLLVVSDTARNPYLFVRHPDWQPQFDMDGPMAARARRAMLDRAAADRTPVAGYHFPFPAYGHIVRRGAGFDFEPALWSPL